MWPLLFLDAALFFIQDNLWLYCQDSVLNPVELYCLENHSFWSFSLNFWNVLFRSLGVPHFAPSSFLSLDILWTLKFHSGFLWRFWCLPLPISSFSVGQNNVLSSLCPWAPFDPELRHQLASQELIKAWHWANQCTKQVPKWQESPPLLYLASMPIS